MEKKKIRILGPDEFEIMCEEVLGHPEIMKQYADYFGITPEKIKLYTQIVVQHRFNKKFENKESDDKAFENM